MAKITKAIDDAEKYTEQTDKEWSPIIGAANGLVRAQLPAIDLILLSHAHFDHLDQATLRALEASGTNVITAPSTSDLLRVNRYGPASTSRDAGRCGMIAVRERMKVIIPHATSAIPLTISTAPAV